MTKLSIKPLKRHHTILVLGILLVTACGGGGAGSDTTTVTTASGGTGSASTTGGSSTRLAVTDLIGTWDNGVYTLTIVEGAQYSIAASGAPDTALMEGFVSAMGSTVSFATGTTGECSAQTGNYKAALEGDSLTFTVSNDPCETRAEGFTAAFTRTG